MSPETKHLLKWWREWLKRLVTTTYHIINRKAYHKWKEKRNKARNSFNDFMDFGLDNMEDFH